MFIVTFLARRALRFLGVCAVAVAAACALLWPQVVFRANDAFCSAVQSASRHVSTRDLAVLRSRIEAASAALSAATERRARLADLLATTEARRVAIAGEQAEAKAVLREIATVLAVPNPIVPVAGLSYKRDVVEADAASALRRFEETKQRLGDLTGQSAELKAAVARVDAYIARAQGVLANRDAIVSRLEERAEYQNLLREIGDLISADPGGFELRLERVETLLTPLSAALEDPLATGLPADLSSARDL